MNLRNLLAVFVLAMSTSGCSAVYSSITPVDGGHYFVTRIKNYAGWVISSRTFYCTPNGEQLNCRKVADP